MEPKALPAAKINPTKLLGSSGGTLTTTIKKISSKSISDDKNSLGIIVIKKQVIHINNLIKTNTLLKAKEEERKRKLAEQKRFGEKEKKLEEPKGKENKIPSLPALPKLGFLERIKNFLFNIFLGYISLRLLPYLPKLAGVAGTIVKVQDIIIDWSGKILNGLVSFVDKAYEVHDKTRKFLGNLGGESFTKTFDGFIGAMDKVIEASIIAAIAFGELRDTGGGPDTGRPGKRRRPKVTRGRGGQKIRFGSPGTGPKVTGGEPRLPTRGSVVKGGLLGLVTLIPDILNSWDLWQNQGRGKDALRTFFSAVTGAIAGLGAVAAVEAGAAALGVTGVGIPAAIALAVAGFAASSLAGTGAYNLTDGILRRMGLVDNDPKTGKPYAYRSGGPVTRGGKLSGAAKRTVQKPKPKRTLKVQTTEVKPGQSVGGKKVIEKVFPEVETKEKGKTVNPLGYMKSSYKIGSSIPGFGGLDAIFMKARLGEKPSGTDYQRAADGLSAWMQRVYGGGIQRTGGFAEGGKVDVSMFNDDVEMKNMLAKALQDTVAPKVDEMINDLKKQLGLKPKEVKKEKEVTEPSPGEELGNATEMVGGARLFMDLGFPPLAAAILAGNVQAESGWKGQRTPWVLNDGAGTNKGLISWNSTRITNAEKFLGKPLETASNAEQVKWIKEELRQYGLLDEFMNPQSTEAQLKESSYKYIGWGIEGDRWKYSSQIYAALQRGERGSYKPSVGGGQGIDGYITGDPSNPNYDPSHGGGNYHDHLSFKDRTTAEKAYRFFTSKGFKVTEFMGYGAGVTGPHSGLGSLHHRGLAFDIPGSQVPVGQERQMSSRVRSTLSEFKSMKMARGGKVKGKLGIDQVRAMLTHGEFVLDVDSTTALEKNFPGFLDALNKANYDGAIKVLRSYAEYEQGATINAMIDEKMIPVPIPISSPQQPSVIISSGLGEPDDYMSSSYRG